MSTTLPLGEVKSHLSELIGRVNSQHERVTVTVHGRPSAALLAVEDLEALEETIAILSDPQTMGSLADSDAELARECVPCLETIRVCWRQTVSVRVMQRQVPPPVIGA